MLKRVDYLELIKEIRNTEKKSIDEYINKVLNPLKKQNEYFIETLYKDIYYLLKDIDKEGENDLEVKDGDFVVEDGDIKFTGYQSRLHNLEIWLHMEMVKKFLKNDPINFAQNMENFERDFLEKPNYTPEYKSSLDKIKRSLKRERKQNLGESESLWTKIWDFDNLELKPNIAGIGIDLNKVINKFRK